MMAFGGQWILCETKGSSKQCGTPARRRGKYGRILDLNRSHGERPAVVLPARRLNRLARFGFAGILATMVYFLIVNGIVLGFGTAPARASVYAYLLSLAFSYFMQSRFTFGVRHDSLGQSLRFVVSSLVGLAVSFCAMSFSVTFLELPYVVGAAVVCILIPLGNFFVFQYWVFASSPAAGGRSGADADI
jgi:putative flippase GtrA